MPFQLSVFPRLLTALAGILFLPGLLPRCSAEELQLQFVAEAGNGRNGYVETVNLPVAVATAIEQVRSTPDAWRELLSVRVAERRDFQAPAMLGSHRLVDGQLRFVPKYAWTPGVTYQAKLDIEKLSLIDEHPKSVTLRFTVPQSPQAPNAKVSAIYPTGPTLPENLLRFYLHFSQPMQQGDSYRHLHLYDASGALVADPFLELSEEMWDRTGTRLTLLIDPGRIKRGLKPREDVGPVFEAGKSYTLVVDRTWKSANRQPLDEEFRKTYRITTEDEIQPNAELWQIDAPRAGSDDALRVKFSQPLDHAMLLRVIHVELDGKPVAGDIEVEPGETVWRFQPQSPWQAGEYRLVAETTLEDSAGNSLGRPFEVDMRQSSTESDRPATVHRAFSVTEP